MVPKAGAKVVHADECVGDGQNDEDDGENRERRERPRRSLVLLLVAGLVNANQLEEEIRQGSEVENDDRAHANLVFATDEEGSEEQDRNCDRNSHERQAELGVGRLVAHND